METQNNQNLILKYLKKDITGKELEVFKKNLNSSGFEETFYQYREIWEQPIEKKSSGFRKYQSLEKLNQKINFYESEKKYNKRDNVFIRYIFRAAAILLIFLIPLSILYRSEAPVNDNNGNITIIVKKGERKKVQMSDGSVVHLNSKSKLIYPESFHHKIRKVILTGEAYFEIAKNAEVPFLVQTENLQTKVLGTSFNIKSSANNTIQISLVEGKVEVIDKTNKERVLLNPSEELIYNKRTKEKLKQQFSPRKITAWKNGELIFENESMATVAKSLENWYNVNIHFDNKRIKNCRVKAMFKNESIDSVLTILKVIGGFDYSITGDKIIIKGKGC